jgi:ATP/maltotriose-dependent transcriptional regulator MalT
VLNDIVAELDNVRAAWRYAQEQGDVGRLQKAYYALWNFYDFRGLYQEGLTTFDETIVRLRGLETTVERALILSSLLSAKGWLHIRLGQYTSAEMAFSQSKQSYADSNQIPAPGLGTDPDTGLAMVALLNGDYEQTLKYAEHARRQNEARNDQQNLQIAHYILSDSFYAKGHYETAREHAYQGYQLALSTNSQWMLGYILITLGNTEFELGHLEGAQRHYQESMAIKQAFGDREGVAVALNQLAEVACQRQDFDNAVALLRQAEALYRVINDQGGLAKNLSNLGKTALFSEDLLTACVCFIQALNETSLIMWIPQMLNLLTNASRLLLYGGERTLALETLHTVINHPSANSRVQGEARRLLDETGSSAIHPDATVISDLDAVTREVQARLLSLKDRLSNSQSSGNSAVAHHQALVEPLSERELEILRLLAEGLSNQEIAQRLTLAIGTIKTHNHNIFSKLGVNDRTHAVARAHQLKII